MRSRSRSERHFISTSSVLDTLQDMNMHRVCRATGTVGTLCVTVWCAHARPCQHDESLSTQS